MASLFSVIEPTTSIGCVMETNLKSIDMRVHAYIVGEICKREERKREREKTFIVFCSRVFRNARNIARTFEKSSNTMSTSVFVCSSYELG